MSSVRCNGCACENVACGRCICLQLERSRVSSELLQSAGECANQNTHASCLSSILARQKMRVMYSRSKMTASIYQEFHSWCSFVGVFCFLASSILSSLAFHFAGDLPR